MLKPPVPQTALMSIKRAFSKHNLTTYSTLVLCLPHANTVCFCVTYDALNKETNISLEGNNHLGFVMKKGCFLR